MGNDSYALVGLLVVLIVLNQWWRPNSRAVRRGIAIALMLAAGLMLLDGWFGPFNLPIDLSFTRPINWVVITAFGIFVFASALRTFVTDYRRATAERLANEKPGA